MTFYLAIEWFLKYLSGSTSSGLFSHRMEDKRKIAFDCKSLVLYFLFAFRLLYLE